MCRLQPLAVLGLVTLHLPLIHSQTSLALGADCYRGFVGTWRGDNGYYRKDGMFSKRVFIHAPVEMIATEDSNGLGLSLEVTYGMKGDRGYEKVHRHTRFDPAHEMAFFTFKNGPEEAYRTVGLAEFCLQAVGKFTLSGPEPRSSRKDTYRGWYELSADAWAYSWDKSADGVSYEPNGTFNMKRVAP